ncbi:MAG: hypothetical protein IPK26_17845 [Planctomycetes bacterium]|nr:hypothetical protein [Planctomycetota bacterium]
MSKPQALSRFSFPVVVAVVALSSVAPVAAQTNLLVNGGAEAGLAGWVDPLGGGFNVSTITVHGGTQAFTAGVGGPTGAHNQEFRQDVSIAAMATAIDAGAITVTFAGFGRTNEAGGAADPGRVVLEFRNSAGTPLATYDSGVFQPFNAWQPFREVRQAPVGTRSLRVRLLGSRQVGVSTDCFFDDMVLHCTDWRLVGTGCAGASGVPALALASPPAPGGTYGLAVSSLSGGIAFMVTGLFAQSLPLQPLGLEFGPACVGQVSLDDVRLLAQSGGLASWSLALPMAGGFAGLNLRSQVVELSAVSAVSNVASVVIH